MKRFLILIFIALNIILKAQSLQINELHSFENIRKFGDFLFCNKDYLRAVNEYDKLLTLKDNDTLEFKIFLAFSAMKKYDLALERYKKNESSIFSDYIEYEYYRILFRSERYSDLNTNLKNSSQPEMQRLYYLSSLFTKAELPEQNNFLNAFPVQEQNNVSELYKRKSDPPYKNPLLAGILSSIIPGTGKIYTNEYGDGIVAFIASSLFAFLSYDNFKADRNFRGWLFAGIGFFFYAGNIYGSVASAQIYNARIDYRFKHDLINYLETKNYFLPDYDFCK
jgi:TM2 domain-containing membrane protein YozV